ncbi:MAG: hypothetical protein AAGK74_00035 [Chloroflexota bacterium]
MKIVIPSYQRAETLTTPLLLEDVGADYVVVVHTDEERAAYIAAGRVPASRVVVSHAPPGVASNRQWAMDNLVDFGDWYLQMDDNVRGFDCVPDEMYNQREIPTDKATQQYLRENAATTTERFLEICEEMVVGCNRMGVSHFGFATTENWMFRSRKYSQVAFVVGKTVGLRKDGIAYDAKLLAMDDYGMTAEQLRVHGAVLVNRFAKPISTHYQAGGIGAYEARLPKKIRDVRYLMRKYPGLFRLNPRAGSHPEAEIVLRFHAVHQIDKWRRSLFA